VFPLVVGSGKRLFTEGTVPSALRLVDSTVSTTGVVIGTYEPAGEIATGSFAELRRDCWAREVTNVLRAATCVAVVAALFCLLAGGCESAEEIRADLESARFYSEYELGSHPGAGGLPVSSHWSVTFKEGEVTWQVEDTMRTAKYEIDDAGNIKATDYYGEEVAGHYDTRSNRLEWNGVPYVAR
jgi:hypothetical protein